MSDAINSLEDILKQPPPKRCGPWKKEDAWDCVEAYYASGRIAVAIYERGDAMMWRDSDETDPHWERAVVEWEKDGKPNIAGAYREAMEAVEGMMAEVDASAPKTHQWKRDPALLVALMTPLISSRSGAESIDDIARRAVWYLDAAMKADAAIPIPTDEVIK